MKPPYGDLLLLFRVLLIDLIFEEKEASHCQPMLNHHFPYQEERENDVKRWNVLTNLPLKTDQTSLKQRWTLSTRRTPVKISHSAEKELAKMAWGGAG